MLPNSYENYILNKDEIIGNIEFIHEFYSAKLKNERDIIIWLPPSYFDSIKKYPVLYMQDGQNLMDPRTSFIGYDWKVDEIVTQLIKQNKIEEIIIVGIYNTKDRIDEYNLFTEKGIAYSNFIQFELKNFIDENYRTLSSADKSAIMGSSMGGLISFQIAWNLPNIFGKAACLSNSFWVNKKEIFKVVKIKKNGIENSKIYVDCGDNEKELFDDNKLIGKNLEEILPKNNFKFHAEKDAIHSERDWAKRLHIPFKIFVWEINYG